jgi:HD-like signal output (HDOD) protein
MGSSADMTHPTEEASRADGQKLPVEDLLTPMREALTAMAKAQRRSEAAIETVLTSIENAVRVVAEQQPGVPPEAPAAEKPNLAAEKPEPAPKLAAVKPQPVPKLAAVKPQPAPTPAPAAAPEARADTATALRRRMVEMQRYAAEIDRLSSSDALGEHLSAIATTRGLRQMLLIEKGRNLHANSCQGFAKLDDRAGSLSRVVVPFDRDGLFGTTAAEEQVYSGPRPVHGMPVDLVLVMGKRAPAWCLVIPLRYRNRWGKFLYIDATAGQLEDIFELEILARLSVMQLRAARSRQHQPAEALRKLRNLTLRERHDRQGRRKRGETDAAPSVPAEVSDDPLSKKSALKRPSPDLRGANRHARFDADGHLIEALKPKEILARIGEIPPMPHVASQVLSKLNDPDTTVQSLQELIATDQALSARLLQIANSSLYGNMREVSVIGEAVMRLGFNSIRSWLLSTITRTVFAAAGSSNATHRLWRQSVLCAMASQTLAERGNYCDPEVAFVAGLLQNIGLLLLARNHPDIFLEIHESCNESLQPYYLGERQVLGFDHADLGALLLNKWGLADELIASVATHHRLELAGDSHGLAATIALGEEIALRLGEGPTESSETTLADTPSAIALAVDSEELDSIYERVAELALDRSIFQA